MRFYPLKFYEIFKPKIWGGRVIESMLGKHLPPDSRIGESWELVDHFDDISTVRNGALEGRRLRDLWRDNPKRFLGEAVAAAKPREFPLLVKFIDASDVLSVQVHPDQEYAARKDPKGEPGKNEVWYVVSAPPGASLIAGLKKGLAREDFRRALKDDKLEECLAKVKVKPGDVVHIAPGTVHAIGKGILLCEIQQTSDATYRLWDWGRPGPDGKPRPLHLDDALAVINFDRGPVSTLAPVEAPSNGGHRLILDKCPSFVLERIELDKRTIEPLPEGSFAVFVCIEGSGALLVDGDRHPYAPGDTILAPAALGAVTIEPVVKSALLKAYTVQ